MFVKSRFYFIWSYFSFSLAYFVLIEINNKLLNISILDLELSFSELNKIKYAELLGALISINVTLFLWKYIKILPLIFSCLIIYYLNIVWAICIDQSIDNLAVHFLINSSIIACLGLAIFVCMMNEENNRQYAAFPLIGFAYIISLILSPELLSITLAPQLYINFIDVMQANIIILPIFISLCVYTTWLKPAIHISNSNFLIIVKNSILENITGFAIFYILAVLVDSYTVYPAMHSLYKIITNEYVYCLFLLLVVVSGFSALYFPLKKPSTNNKVWPLFGLYAFIYIIYVFWSSKYTLNARPHLFFDCANIILLWIIIPYYLYKKDQYNIEKKLYIGVAVLLVLFVCLYFIGSSITNSIADHSVTLPFIFWHTIFATCYLLIIASISRLVKKFNQCNRIEAMILFVAFCTAGYYCGYNMVNTNNIITTSEKGGILAICLILATILLYHIYYLNKWRRYKILR
ncbi:MAG: hypothetical protein AB8B66_00205 [Rickettsiaceae bacterium]